MSSKIQRRWDKRKDKVVSCSNCGSERTHLVRRPRALNQYNIECWNCHWRGKHANTINGAISKWNNEMWNFIPESDQRKV